MPKIHKVRIETTNADVNVEKQGVYSEEKYEKHTNVEYKQFNPTLQDIRKIAIKSTMKLPINNANKQVLVKLNKQVLVSPEFLELWEKVKYKTKYRFKLDE